MAEPWNLEEAYKASLAKGDVPATPASEQQGLLGDTPAPALAAIGPQVDPYKEQALKEADEMQFSSDIGGRMMRRDYIAKRRGELAGQAAPAASPTPTPLAPAKTSDQIGSGAPSGPPMPPASQPGHPLYDTSRTTGSSGLSADAQKRAGARLDEVGRQQAGADDAALQAKQARAEYEVRATEEALSEASQRRREVAAEQAVNDHITSEVDRKMQAASDWQPDRGRVWSGETGAARGILAAISVIAGGWMQGRGMTSTNQFLPLVIKMIDDDVADQIRSNSANIQFLREQKGDLKAAGLELKKRQMQAADAMIQAKVASGAAKDPSVQAALEAYRKDSAAKQAAWDADQRKSLERTTTEQVTRTPRATGPAPLDTYNRQRIEKLNEARDVLSTLERGMQSGKLAEAVGPLDKNLHSLASSLGVADAEVTEQRWALGRHVMNETMKLVREPSNKLQEAFADLNEPKSDAEIPIFMQKLRRAHSMAEREAMAEGVPTGQAVATTSRAY